MPTDPWMRSPAWRRQGPWQQATGGVPDVWSPATNPSAWNSSGAGWSGQPPQLQPPGSGMPGFPGAPVPARPPWVPGVPGWSGQPPPSQPPGSGVSWTMPSAPPPIYESLPPPSMMPTPYERLPAPLPVGQMPPWGRGPLPPAGEPWGRGPLPWAGEPRGYTLGSALWDRAPWR